LVQLNKKISEANHNLNESPFIDKEVIKKIVIKELESKNSQINKQNLSDEDIEKIVDEKVKMLIEKYKKLEK